jgi:hypothetical protein
MFKSLLLLDTKVRLWLLFVSFFFLFFFWVGGGHIFAFRTKIRKRTSYKSSKIRERRNLFLFFQKLKLKIKDEKDRTKNGQVYESDTQKKKQESAL